MQFSESPILQFQFRLKFQFPFPFPFRVPFPFKSSFQFHSISSFQFRFEVPVFSPSSKCAQFESHRFPTDLQALYAKWPVGAIVIVVVVVVVVVIVWRWGRMLVVGASGRLTVVGCWPSGKGRRAGKVDKWKSGRVEEWKRSCKWASGQRLIGCFGATLNNWPLGDDEHLGGRQTRDSLRRHLGLLNGFKCSPPGTVRGELELRVASRTGKASLSWPAFKWPVRLIGPLQFG